MKLPKISIYSLKSVGCLPLNYIILYLQTSFKPDQITAFRAETILFEDRNSVMIDQLNKTSSSNEAPGELRRHLHNRHIQLIALGGAIGTGLFMGSGKTISLAGPSIIFVYMIIGFMLFFVMRAMGELLLSNLEYKSFSDFAADLLGPWAGYFTGWTYWFCWVATGIADVVAISSYFQLWFPDFSIWMSALLCIVVFLALNIATVKLFGEMEFWLPSSKLLPSWH